MNLPIHNIFVIASNASTCIILVHDDEPVRLETQQENITQRYEIQKVNSNNWFTIRCWSAEMSKLIDTTP